MTPFDEYIERQGAGRAEPPVAPVTEQGDAGLRRRELVTGRPYVGASAASPAAHEGLPVLQEAQRTAGVTIAPGRSYGFFTDTTLCIGCKACEVACKQWNNLPADASSERAGSYDHTGSFSATTWRHVRFVEQFDAGRFDDGAAGGPGRDPGPSGAGAGGGVDGTGSEPGMADLPATFEPWGNLTTSEQWAQPGNRWMFMSDVCKHCVHAPCLEACPTGSIIRTEFDTVYIQQDVCNGCGYCQTACPFGVVQVSKEGDGKAHKCTLCYDRLKDGLEPACAKSCPTDSIQFGPVDELLERAWTRVAELRDRGVPAYLYGSGNVLEDGCDTSEIGGLNCFFLLIDRPEVYNLPPVPRRPSNNTLPGLVTGLAVAAGVAAATIFTYMDSR